MRLHLPKPLMCSGKSQSLEFSISLSNSPSMDYVVLDMIDVNFLLVRAVMLFFVLSSS